MWCDRYNCGRWPIFTCLLQSNQENHRGFLLPFWFKETRPSQKSNVTREKCLRKRSRTLKRYLLCMVLRYRHRKRNRPFLEFERFFSCCFLDLQFGHLSKSVDTTHDSKTESRVRYRFSVFLDFLEKSEYIRFNPFCPTFFFFLLLCWAKAYAALYCYIIML